MLQERKHRYWSSAAVSLGVAIGIFGCSPAPGPGDNKNDPAAECSGTVNTCKVGTPTDFIANAACGATQTWKCTTGSGSQNCSVTNPVCDLCDNSAPLKCKGTAAVVEDDGAKTCGAPHAWKCLSGTTKEQCGANNPECKLCDNSAPEKCKSGAVVSESKLDPNCGAKQSWKCTDSATSTSEICGLTNPACELCDLSAPGNCFLNAKSSGLNIDNTCEAKRTWTCTLGTDAKTCETKNPACGSLCDNSSLGKCLENATSDDKGVTTCGEPRTWNCTLGTRSNTCTGTNPPCTNSLCDYTNLGKCYSGATPGEDDEFTKCGATRTWKCTPLGTGSPERCVKQIPSCDLCNKTTPGECNNGAQSADDNGLSTCGTTRKWTCNGTDGKSEDCTQVNPICSSCSTTVNDCKPDSNGVKPYANNWDRISTCGATTRWNCSAYNSSTGVTTNEPCSAKIPDCTAKCSTTKPGECERGMAGKDNNEIICGGNRTWSCVTAGTPGSSENCSLPVKCGVCSDTPGQCKEGASSEDDKNVTCGEDRSWVCSYAGGPPKLCKAKNAACGGRCGKEALTCIAETGSEPSEGNGVTKCGEVQTWICESSSGKETCSVRNPPCDMFSDVCSTIYGKCITGTPKLNYAPNNTCGANQQWTCYAFSGGGQVCSIRNPSCGLCGVSAGTCDKDFITASQDDKITACGTKRSWKCSASGVTQDCKLDNPACSWIPMKIDGKTSDFGFSSLNGVWGFSAKDAWVVGGRNGGNWQNGKVIDDTPFIYHWNGTAWSTKKEGLPSDSKGILYKIWGTKDNDIWAVGGYSVRKAEGGVTDTLPSIFQWTGSWSNKSDTLPTGTKGILYGVWGSSASDVWAVGAHSFYDSSGWQQKTIPVILHWDGDKWTKKQDGLADDTEGRLVSVWGTSQTDVWAVGTDKSGLAPYLIHWDGNGWSKKHDGLSSEFKGVISSVWGLTAGDVWAVGYSIIDTMNQNPLVLHWTGSAWSDESASIPKNTKGMLSSIWGRSANEVWAVGTPYSLDNAYARVTLFWDGKSWVHKIGTGDGLAAVWGFSADDYWAVNYKGIYRWH